MSNTSAQGDSPYPTREQRAAWLYGRQLCTDDVSEILCREKIETLLVPLRFLTAAPYNFTNPEVIKPAKLWAAYEAAASIVSVGDPSVESNRINRQSLATFRDAFSPASEFFRGVFPRSAAKPSGTEDAIHAFATTWELARYRGETEEGFFDYAMSELKLDDLEGLKNDAQSFVQQVDAAQRSLGRPQTTQQTRPTVAPGSVPVRNTMSHYEIPPSPHSVTGNEAPSFGGSDPPEDQDIDFDFDLDPEAIAALLNSVPGEDSGLFPPLDNSQFGGYHPQSNAPGSSHSSQPWNHPTQ